MCNELCVFGYCYARRVSGSYVIQCRSFCCAWKKETPVWILLKRYCMLTTETTVKETLSQRNKVLQVKNLI